jgi:mannitol-specific phosphotransferase system IIBC component
MTKKDTTSRNSEDKTVLNSTSKRIQWVMGIIASIVVFLVITSFTMNRDTREKAEYSYEAVQRIEKRCESQQKNMIQREEFVQYKEYQVEKDKMVIDMLKDIKEDVKELRRTSR